MITMRRTWRMTGLLLALLCGWVGVKGQNAPTDDVKEWKHEFQRYDGWYNNFDHISYGSTGRKLIYLVPPKYSDGVYMPSGEGRPDAGLVSAELFSGVSEEGSTLANNKRTAFFAFFGQAVSGEILSTVSSGNIACPVERMKLKMFTDANCKKPPSSNSSLKCDKTKGEKIPFFRTSFNPNTGQHINNPRRPTNFVTSWIDASFIYGTNTWWSDSLRTFKDGLLKTEHGLLPDHENPFLVLGSFKSNQEPPLLAVAVVMHRLHNHFALRLKKDNMVVVSDREKGTTLERSDSDLFQRARQWVTAVWQHILMEEYLEKLVGAKLPPYDGYHPEIDPSISVEFQGAAFRFGHSLIPSHFSSADQHCNFTRLSLCEFWWNSQDALEKYGLDGILRGAIYENADKGDHIFNPIMREKMFGGLRRTQRDLPALNTLRGRDVGLADYNTVRVALGFKKRNSWMDINTRLFRDDQQLLKRAEELYGKTMDNIDLYVGGLLESHAGLPGETFVKIILNQFRRIRDGDRFWFENEQNGLFTRDEIQEIKSGRYSMAKVLTLVTNITKNDIGEPETVFSVPPLRNTVCNNNAESLDHKERSERGQLGEECGPSGTIDFFSGSELSFVLSFAFLAAFPLFLCFVGWILAYKRHRALLDFQDRLLTRVVKMTQRMKDTFMASEYDGPKVSRRVQVSCGPGAQIVVNNKDGTIQRVIKISDFPYVDIRISFNGNNTGLIVHVHKEYDLILFFHSMMERTEFVQHLQSFLDQIRKPLVYTYLSYEDFLEGAVTCAERKETLQIFFHTAFDQVFRAKQKSSAATLKWPRYVSSFHRRSSVIRKRDSLFKIELNAQEFSDALQLKQKSMFVQQMFHLADKDRNGYISYQEFLDILALLSKGTMENKTRMLFDMYDMDGSGDLDHEEFYTMIRSLLEITNRDVTEDQLDSLVQAMLQECGLGDKRKLNYHDFHYLVDRNQSVVWNDDDVLQTFGLTKNEQNMTDVSRTMNTVVVRTKDEGSNMEALMKYYSRYVENQWNQILIASLYLLITILLFIQYFFKYAFFNEHKGLRHIVGLGASVSRGSAMSISFSVALLILTVCRNLLSLIRNTTVGYYLPVDSAISFHRFLAMMIMLFSAVHIIGHGINFYHIGTQPPNVLKCILPEIYIPTYELLKFDFWLFQTTPGISGVLLVIVLSIIYVFATGKARQHIYPLFWKTHGLFPIVFILLFVHGSRGFLQGAVFPYFVIGPLVLFMFDWLIRLRHRSIDLQIINVEALPSGVLHMSFKLPETVSFHSGQWMRVACDALSVQEFHPFTITSAPHEKTLDVYIRSVGPWTKRMYSIFKKRIGNKEAFPRMILDGPYGSRHQDWYKFEIVVLVGAGIGVTPHASVLKDLVYKVYHQRFDIVCKKVYFVWMARTHQQFEWFVDILAEVERQDKNHLIHTDIFVTQLIKDFDIRTMMLYICESQFQRLSNKSLFTGLRAKTHFGRIDFKEYLQSVKRSNPSAKKVGVFSCGPKSAIGTVDIMCQNLNKTGTTPQLIAKHEIF